MKGNVVYVEPSNVDNISSSGTLSDDPFQPIDLIDEANRSNEAIDAALLGFRRAFWSLWKAMRCANGTLEIQLESINNSTKYGHLDKDGIAALVLAMCIGRDAKVSFRTYREALETALNLIVGMFEMLPEDQRPGILNELNISNGGAVGFGYYGGAAGFSYFPEKRAEYRLTALALKVMGDYRWHCVRDSVNPEFDCYGKAILCVDDKDEFDRLMIGTDDRCIMCGRGKAEVKHFLGLNKYSFICDECLKKAYEAIEPGTNAEIIHDGAKSEMQKQREVMETLDKVL